MSSKMEYKGYVASVEFDDVDDILHGRVINSGPYPIVTFEAKEPRLLQYEFERSIDEYLRWCDEDGVATVEPHPAEVRLCLEPALHSAVAQAAGAGKMSIDAWIIQLIRKGVVTWSRDAP